MLHLITTPSTLILKHAAHLSLNMPRIVTGLAHIVPEGWVPVRCATFTALRTPSRINSLSHLVNILNRSGCKAIAFAVDPLTLHFRCSTITR